jgi:hypothetical protein
MAVIVAAKGRQGKQIGRERTEKPPKAIQLDTL